MGWNPQNYINRWNGRGLDIDGVASVQCVDAFKQCLKDIGYPNPTRPIGGSGGAKEIWYRREALGYSQYFEFVQTMKFGDWCIWDSNLGGGYGHVAMFVSDNGNGTGRFFGQNQSYPNSPFDTVNMSYAHSLGALRVKPQYWEASYDPSKLISEKGRAYFRNSVPIIIHKDSPTGPNVGQFVNGEIQDYTEKYIGNGHRYISWLDPVVGNSRCFAAVSATEQRPAEGSDEQWATFGPIPESQPNPPKEPDKPKPDFPNSVKYKGIDISEHNGDINVSGQEFVIIRATFGTNLDKCFLDNVKKCNELNIPFGVYCYDYALNDEQAKEEAIYLDKLLKDNDIIPKLGVWFDMEDADGYKNKNSVLNPERCTNSCNIFCDYFKGKGYYTGVYSSESWFGTYVLDFTYPKWIASWSYNDGSCNGDFSKDAILHQYTSKPLDKNVMYVEMEELTSNPKEETKPLPDIPVFPDFNVDAMNEFFEVWTELGKRLLG